MAWFCYAWKITPREYEQLTFRELDAMERVLREVKKAQDEQAARMRSSGRRRR